MITFDDSIIDKPFCDKAKSIQQSIETIGGIINRDNADELYKTLTQIADNK